MLLLHWRLSLAHPSPAEPWVYFHREQVAEFMRNGPQTDLLPLAAFGMWG